VKLLIVDQFSELGGGQQCLLDLLPGIKARGWQALVGLPGDGPLVPRVREAGFETVTLDCGPYACGYKTVADAARFLTQLPRLRQRIRWIAERFGADLLYVNGPRLLPAATGIDLPVIHHAHRILPGRALRELCGRAVRRSGASVIAVCRYVAASWQPFAGAGHVAVIYNGVAGTSADRSLTVAARKPLQDGRRASDPEAASHRDRQYGHAVLPQKAGGVVGCVGRIAPEKGQLEFVKVAALIHNRVPDCRFEVHGAAVLGDPRYERTVRAAAARLPIDFAGWTSDVPAAMAGLDLLLVPSDPNEATPLVILQAFAAGTPVVAFASGGIPEMIEDGRTGILVNSVEEMTDRSLELLRDPGRRARIAAAAYESWQSRFTLARWRDEVLDYISSRNMAPAASANAPAPASTGA
jgi:glycosyltransferase involved in cell wall biosynthesis